MASFNRLLHPTMASSGRTPTFFVGALFGVLIVACSGSGTNGPSSTISASPLADGTAPTARARGKLQLTGHLTPEIQSATVVGRVEPSRVLAVTLGLEIRDPAALEAAVEKVSNPQSPLYRKYLTPEEFGERFGVTATQYQTVIEWAKANNFSVIPHANRLVLQISGSVDAVESAFHVHMQYGLRADGSQFYAPDVEPSLEIGVPVAHVGNLENYVVPRSATGSGFEGSYQGPDFRNAYAASSTLRGTGQAVGVLMLDGFSQSDVTSYFNSMSLTAPRSIQTVPAGTQTSAGVEGDLDVQMVLSMAPDAQVVAFVGGVDSILSNMAARTDVKQLTSSWFTQIDSTAMALMAEFALQGQSFFQASGDGGALVPTYFSLNNDFRTQPTATLVGGTALDMTGSGAGYGSESAWPLSSGGILSYNVGGGVPIPSYQVGLGNTANQGSALYRNMPDVSAEAAAANIYYEGAPYVASGTSAATPLWAGFMALVNQQAAANGQASIGFANPALYALARNSAASYSANFNDITTGSTATPGANYSAVSGYDLSTGLGSPRSALIGALGGRRTSDILWRDAASGAVELWRMRNGDTFASPTLSPLDSTWAVQGTGDFNGDGTGDILWRNSGTGNVVIWQMENGAVSANLNVSSAVSDWVIQGTGDFNGDGTTDILWRQTSTGSVAIWQMAKGAISAYVNLSSAVADWVIQGTGDFNGDGTTDILWRQTSTGSVGIWQIKLGAISAYKSPSSAISDWVIKGTGDFNGDGTADILWRQTSTGGVGIWQMKNGAIAAKTSPSSAIADWVIQGTGDFNDDGISDILWRQASTGSVQIWQMANGAINAYLSPGSAPAAWTIRGAITD